MQRLGTAVPGKAQRYILVVRKEFVAFNYHEVNITKINKAWAKKCDSSIGDDIEVEDKSLIS